MSRKPNAIIFGAFLFSGPLPSAHLPAGRATQAASTPAHAPSPASSFRPMAVSGLSRYAPFYLRRLRVPTPSPAQNLRIVDKYAVMPPTT